MDFLKSTKTQRGEWYLIPFAVAIKDNDFHVSFHNESYGMHLKINKPYPIQSEPIRYTDLAKIVNDSKSEILKQYTRLPKSGYDYYWIIPEVDDHAFRVKGTPNRTISIKAPFLRSIEVIHKSETFFIPRDFMNLRNSYNREYFMGFVQYTNEIFWFMPLSINQIDSAADMSENLDYDLHRKIGGIFITMKLDNISLFKEYLPEIYEKFFSFFIEVANNGIELYDQHRLAQLLQIDSIADTFMKEVG